ncbi:MAG: ThuA domain-containing protein [Alphaproteobacteria bacterium]|nr:ThuA domain-containing protein [Alphaproteobacteria bacterium]
MTQRAHLITGGFPPGSAAGHDMDYARLQLLQMLRAKDHLTVTAANDFQDIERWLPGTDLLITYVAGPYPAGTGNEALLNWLENGGRWFALHGTSGGKAVKTENKGLPVKKMVKAEHHQTLGCFFLNHPPLREFQVSVAGDHRVTRDLPKRFTVRDELYLIELQDPHASRILLTTELAEDPSPPGFGFFYDEDTSLQPDGKTRVLGYSREMGRGEVVYIGLGHCHANRTDSRSSVDPSIHPERTMPPEFRGVWETDVFALLLQNAIAWGTDKR